MNVYKHYKQDQLDYQYNTRLQVPEYATYFDRWERLSRQTELHNTILKDISYGTHPEERLDIYPSKIHLSKTLVFIHGGYWQRFFAFWHKVPPLPKLAQTAESANCKTPPGFRYSNRLVTPSTLHSRSQTTWRGQLTRT